MILSLVTLLTWLTAFIVLTLLFSHVGLAWSGVLLKKDNIFEDLAKEIRKIKSKYFRNLLQCHKCVAGQFTLWSYVIACIYFQVPFTVWSVLFPVAWICLVVVVTDQLYKKYGYDKKEEAALAVDFLLWAAKEKGVQYSNTTGWSGLGIAVCPVEERIQNLLIEYKAIKK